jgi:hypothetical protein
MFQRAASRGEAEMTKYLAGVLTVIAAGVLLVAYGLLTPRTTMDAMTVAAAPGYAAPASGAVAAVPAASLLPMAYASAPAPYAQPVAMAAPVPAPVRTVGYSPEPAPRRTVRRVEAPRNDWKKTAMIIGGSSAAGAGVGAIFGGRKGALIGAAIGGGASTIYEVTK